MIRLIVNGACEAELLSPTVPNVRDLIKIKRSYYEITQVTYAWNEDIEEGKLEQVLNRVHLRVEAV
jgi:hypothetical protein